LPLFVTDTAPSETACTKAQNKHKFLTVQIISLWITTLCLSRLI